MSLQKRLLGYIGTCIVVLGFGACQKDIPRDERFVPAQERVLDEYEGATLLVEKFTGQLCVNCPGGARVLKEQEDIYPNRMVTVALHAKSSRLTQQTLESNEAEEYAKAFVQRSFTLPGIVLSRRLDFSGYYYGVVRGTWAGAIRKYLRTPRKYYIDLSSRMKKEGGIEVKMKVSALSNSKVSNLMLQLWVVEDVISNQVGVGGGADYHHHNVLRGALNGTWGSELELEKEFTESYTLPKAVLDVNESKVVAFVYDKETREVYEATIKKIEV